MGNLYKKEHNIKLKHSETVNFTNLVAYKICLNEPLYISNLKLIIIFIVFFNHAYILFIIISVSYTHLDVYKRQD